MIHQSIKIHQSVAILVDGNNIEKSIHELCGNDQVMLNFDSLIPHLLDNRGLNRLIYFREGKNISSKLAERLYMRYHGSVCPCHKSADIPLTIKAMQLAKKVDTIIILSGDSDYIELVRHLKSEGVRVEIASILETTANILREEADFYSHITQEHWFKLEHNNSYNSRQDRPHFKTEKKGRNPHSSNSNRTSSSIKHKKK